MKKNNIILLLILISACGRTIVDPKFTSVYRIKNTIHSDVIAKIYKSGAIIQEFHLAPNAYNEYEGADDAAPLFYHTDSIQILFINGKIKTDFPCFNYYDSAGFANCRKDTVSLYNEERAEVTKIKENHYLHTVFIHEDDSLEAK